MTIHVTVRDPAGTPGEVEIVKPKRGRVVRSESDRIEFEVPAKSRQLVFQRGSGRGRATTPVTFDLEAGKDNQEFDMPDTGPRDDVLEGDLVDEDATDDRTRDDRTRDDRTRDDRTRDDVERDDVDRDRDRSEAEDVDEVREFVLGSVGALAQRVGALEERILVVGSVADRIYRLEGLTGLSDVPDLPRLKAYVEDLMNSVAEFPAQAEKLRDVRKRVRQLETLPDRVEALEQSGGQAVVSPQTPVTGDISDLTIRAEMSAREVREGFRVAGEVFAADVGLDADAVLTGTVQSPAARTARLLAVATSTAEDRAERYAELRADPRKRQLLTRDSFVREVRNAGAFYAATVEEVNQLALQATATDRPAYGELLENLRSRQLSAAIDASHHFAP